MAEREQLEKLINRAKVRIRVQYALDSVTLGLAVGLFAAAAVTAMWKAGSLGGESPAVWLALCSVFPLGGLVWALLKPLDPIAVAAAIDRANDFDDRISSAFEFLGSKELTTFQKAQVEDTLARIESVDPSRAHEMRRPPDLVALGIGALALLIVFLVQFPPPSEELPVGNAGPDQTVVENSPVELDGTASRSLSNEPLTYEWSQQDGPPVELSSRESPSPSFTAPEVDEQPIILTFQLVVSDGRHESYPDEVVVVVDNPPPVVTNLSEDIRRFREDQVNELLKKAEESGDEETKEAAEELKELLEEDKLGKLTPQEFNEKLNSVADSMKSNCDSVDYPALMTALKPLSPLFSKDDFVAQMKAHIDAGDFEEASVELDTLGAKVWSENAFADGLGRDAFFSRLDGVQEEYLLCERKELAKAEKKIQEAAEELKKMEETKEIGKSLEEGDYEKAAKQIEELAKQIDLGNIDPKTAEKLASLLEKFADQLDLNDPALAREMEKHKDLINKLKRKMDKKGSLSKKEQRRLDDAKKNLERLQREKEKNERGAGRRLKRLQRKTKAAADELRKQDPNAREEKEGDRGEKRQGQKGQQDGQKQDGQKGQDGQKQAGDEGKLDKKDGEGDGDEEQASATDELRKLDRDKRNQKTKEELEETAEKMEEDAKRSEGGNSGKKDGAKASKIDDYLNRRKGQQPQGEGQGQGKDGQGKDGQGKGQGQAQGKGQGKDGEGQGKGQPGGQGDKPGGDQWGDGSGDDPEGGRTKDLDGQAEKTEVKGQKGAGPSKAETIKKASQQGFASRRYKEVYDEYESAVEDVLEQEKVPPGYKHYVRRYFDAIRPAEESE